MDHLTSRTAVALRACVWIVGVAALIVCGARGIDAHKPVTSPYDYNKDVFPLLRAHCAPCHVEGGAAPMSLMTYKDAVPWAESIRDELTEGRMPPWPVSTKSRAVRGGHPISAHDLDADRDMGVVGGTPHDWSGHPNQALPAVAAKTGMEAGVRPSLPATRDGRATQPRPPTHSKRTCDFSLSASTTEAKWIRAADLLPGTPSMVRDAVISAWTTVRCSRSGEPGGDRITAPAGTAFRPRRGREDSPPHSLQEAATTTRGRTSWPTRALLDCTLPTRPRPRPSSPSLLNSRRRGGTTQARLRRFRQRCATGRSALSR